MRNVYSGALDRGHYQMQWDRRDDNGKQVASGVYYARVAVDGRALTSKVTVL